MFLSNSYVPRWSILFDKKKLSSKFLTLKILLEINPKILIFSFLNIVIVFCVSEIANLFGVVININSSILSSLKTVKYASPVPGGISINR